MTQTVTVTIQASDPDLQECVYPIVIDALTTGLRDWMARQPRDPDQVHVTVALTAPGTLRLTVADRDAEARP